MSARVLLPMMPRRASPTGAAAPTTTPTTPDAAVARVRRDLFGPVDRDATRRFLERELAAQSERDADRWGFDFLNEAPRRQGPGTARYTWERVGVDADDVPETYALNRMQCLKSAPAVAAAAATARQEDAVVVASTVEGVVVVAAVDAGKKAKQSQITDFMRKEKPRKRRMSAGDTDACSTSASIAVVGAETPRAKLARSTPS